MIFVAICVSEVCVVRCSTWTYDKTDQYLQICLAYGLWPGFFSADAARATYFGNHSLFDRDRPLFKMFIPPLHKINQAGWRPVTLANATADSGGPFQLERWGAGFGKAGKAAKAPQLLFTVRSLAPVASHGVALRVQGRELGLSDPQGFTAREIVHGKPISLSHAGGWTELAVGAIAANQTLVLEVKYKGAK